MRITSKSRGLTLFEVIIAVAVLAIGVLALFGMFPTAAVAMSDARNLYSGTELAREKLEFWVQKGYATVQPSPATLDSGAIAFTGSSGGSPQTVTLNYQITHTTIQAGKIEAVEAFVWWRQQGGVGAPAYLDSVRLDTWVTPTWITP